MLLNTQLPNSLSKFMFKNPFLSKHFFLLYFHSHPVSAIAARNEPSNLEMMRFVFYHSATTTGHFYLFTFLWNPWFYHEKVLIKYLCRTNVKYVLDGGKDGFVCGTTFMQVWMTGWLGVFVWVWAIASFVERKGEKERYIVRKRVSVTDRERYI